MWHDQTGSWPDPLSCQLPCELQGLVISNDTYQCVVELYSVTCKHKVAYCMRNHVRTMYRFIQVAACVLVSKK